jgi:hypothetical protein
MRTYYVIFSFFLQFVGLLASAARVALSLIRAALTILPQSPRHALRILALGGIVRFRTWSFFVRTLLVDFWPKPFNANFVEGRRIRLAIANAMVAFCSLYLIRYMSVGDIMLIFEELDRASFFEELAEHGESFARAIPDQHYGPPPPGERALHLFLELLGDNPALWEELKACLDRAFKRIGKKIAYTVEETSTWGVNEKGQPCWDAFGLKIEAAPTGKTRRTKGRKGRKGGKGKA